jgi:hypothetical protein
MSRNYDQIDFAIVGAFVMTSQAVLRGQSLLEEFPSHRNLGQVRRIEHWFDRVEERDFENRIVLWAVSKGTIGNTLS